MSLLLLLCFSTHPCQPKSLPQSEGEYYEGKPSKPYYKPHMPNPPSPEYYTETPGYDPHPQVRVYMALMPQMLYMDTTYMGGCVHALRTRGFSH
jgi:hypothetical protein